jgi:altronate dehydratase
MSGGAEPLSVREFLRGSIEQKLLKILQGYRQYLLRGHTHVHKETLNPGNTGGLTKRNDHFLHADLAQIIAENHFLKHTTVR